MLSLSFALWISPPRSCWQEGGGPAALGLRPMQQPSLRQTQAVLLLHTSHQYDHHWLPISISCLIMVGILLTFHVHQSIEVLQKIELCDGVCCFSTSPHIWNCMKLPFLEWLESLCPERFIEHESPRCSRIPCMLGNLRKCAMMHSRNLLNFYGSLGDCISHVSRQLGLARRSWPFTTHPQKWGIPRKSKDQTLPFVVRNPLDGSS